jgi:CBS domain-containing protein
MSLRATRGSAFRHIAGAAFFLLAGVGALWFVQDVLDVDGDAVLVAVLVLPLFVYLTLSGRVSGFGAGGLSVKLADVSREPVGRIAKKYAPVDPVVGSDPHGETLKTNPNRPHVVTLSQGVRYTVDQVLGRLRELARWSPVPFLIILDDRNRVLAYMTYRSALDLLEREERYGTFLELVRSGDPDAFDDGGGFSAIRTEVLSCNATNAEALTAMDEADLDELVVVDRKGRFQGIVERDRVLSRMMLALVPPTSTT